MGNRAVITTAKKDIGVYLHWNGGRDSVEAFLKYCDLQGYRSPETDNYGWARLCQVIGNFFGGSCSIGIGKVFDPGDNGIYIIENWKIVGRDGLYDGFTEQNEYNLDDALQSIDERQPKYMQLGDFLEAKEINTNELKVGDVVYIQDFTGEYDKLTVIGFGKDEYVNGTNVLNIPFVNKYGKDLIDYSQNPNNYIRTEKIRLVK